MSHLFFVRHAAEIAIDDPHRRLVWRPLVDVYRCAQGWLLKFELAGVRAEDVHIEVDNHGITISGVRRDFREIELQEAHLMEISYSRFERFVALPEPIEDVDLGAECRDGMMYLRVITKGNYDR